MAVSYVGAGTYQSGNNAPVTPGIPLAAQPGDLLVIAVSIGDSAASVDTPPGWTLGISGSEAAADVAGALLWRVYQAGDLAPTVTFTGNGAQDTTQAIMLAYRGVHPTTPMQPITAQFALPTNESVFTLPDANYAVGDAILFYSAVGNDEPPDTGGYYTELPSENPGSTDTTTNTTTQGRDGTLHTASIVVTAEYTGGNTGHKLYVAELAAGSLACTDGVILFAEAATQSHVGTGGAVAGGAATASLRSSVRIEQGTGGAVAGGAAQASLRTPTFAYLGTGGAVAGGAAVASVRETIRVETGAGGAVLGGAATTSLVAPANHHIDPFAGNDANDGTSWGSALRTFLPIAAGTVALGNGDRIKIAKTPAPVNHGNFTNRKLSSHPHTGTSHGWSAGGGFSLGTFFDGKMQVIERFDTTTGWTVDASFAFQQSTETLRPYNLPNYRAAMVGTYLQDRLLAHKTLPATLNLSGYARVEVRVGIHLSTDPNETPGVLGLSLCSDTAGATELLRLTLSPSEADSTVWAFEGVLPDGVNSIAFRSVVAGTASSTYYNIHSFIACAAHDSPDYIGNLSQFQLGEHEGSTWMLPMGFYESGGSNYVMLSHNVTGPASMHDTTMRLRSRTSVGWTRCTSSPGLGTSSLVATHGVRGVRADGALVPAFDLVDLKSISSDPITISGGWDTATNTITGETAISHRMMDGVYTENPHVPAIWCALTEYFTFQNIDLCTNNTSLFAVEDNNKGLRFENCGLRPMMYNQASTQGLLSTVVHQTGTSPSLTDCHFQDCEGYTYLYTINTTEATQSHLNSIAQYQGLVLENCILMPWCGVPLGIDSYIGFNTPAELLGTLKVYCVGQRNRMVSAYVDSYNYQLPAIKSGSAGVLHVFGGGFCFMTPVASADGAVFGVYLFPKLVLENTFPAFCTTRQLNNNSGYYSRGGDVEYMEVPEITLTTTAAPWHEIMDGSTSLSYNVSHFLGTYTPDTPPLHVKKFTMSGGWWPGYSLGRECAIVYTEGGTVQISDIDVTGAASEYSFQLIGTKSTLLGDGGGAAGERLGIIDGYVGNPTAYADTLYLVGNQSDATLEGLFDIRNAVVDNTNAAEHVYASMSGNYGCWLRFQNCTITNPTEEPYVEPNNNLGFSSGSYYALGGGFESGVLYENSTIAATPAVTPSSAADIDAAESSGVVDFRAVLTLIDDVAQTHAVYVHDTVTVEKDYSIFPAGDHSWKVTGLRRLYSPLSLNLPVATVPVKAGKTVTVTIQTRRGHADAHCALVVHHNGCGGNAVASDFQEFIANNTATVGDWETLQVQFSCVLTGFIDVAMAHFGVEGQSTWFTDFRVIET